MRKILFVASVYSHLAAFHKPYMRSFQERGFEVHAAANNLKNRKEEILDMDIICHDIQFERNPFSKNTGTALKEIKHLFKHNYFDLIHVHTPTAAFLTRYVASKENQGSILYTAHGFHFYKGASLKNWLLFYPAEKIARRWTDGIVVMNKEDYKLGRRLGYKENTNLFSVHGVGVDLMEFQGNSVKDEVCIRQELGLKIDSLVISCIAELSERKNQLFLLENWSEINLQCPNSHLVFVGDGNDRGNLESFILERKLKNVHLLGYRKDIPNIISSSDLITLVSKHEGLPRCLMEAMACGKAIVTSNVRGSSDLVEHRNTGITVELRNNEQLVKGIVELLQDSKMRADFGKRGKRKIQSYSLKNVLSEMNAIYDMYL